MAAPPDVPTTNADATSLLRGSSLSSIGMDDGNHHRPETMCDTSLQGADFL
jgi:hypothetical protein